MSSWIVQVADAIAQLEDVVVRPENWPGLLALGYLLVLGLALAVVLLKARLSASLGRYRCTVAEPNIELADGSDQSSPAVRITLVHGTWARRGAWHQQGSAFRRRLLNALAQNGIGRVEFRQFLWSGGNSVGDRERAAKALLSSITQEPDRRYPEFVIAHSHGGTVALRAALLHGSVDNDGSPLFDGVVCMGTPFLVGSKRERFWLAALSVIVGPLIAAYVLVSWQLDGLRPLLDKVSHDWTWFFATQLPILGLLGFALFVAASVRGDLIPGYGIQQSVARRLFVIRSTGDEASAALSASFMATWVINKVAAALVLPFVALGDAAETLSTGKRRRGVLRLVFAMSAGASIASLFMVFGLRLTSPNTPWQSLLGLGCLLVAVLFLLWAVKALLEALSIVFKAGLAVALHVTTQCIVGSLLLPFGPELILASSFVVVSAEPTPPVEDGGAIGGFVQLGLEDGVLAGLRHSVYDDSRTASYIARWVADSLAPVSASAAGTVAGDVRDVV